jgi:hypothetical protein
MTVTRKKPPELTFQEHIAAYLVREHRYPVLEQAEITDTEHFIAEDHLWAFLKVTQKDTLDKLAADYGTDARDEVFKTLRSELRHTPLWVLFRHGLKVRGLEIRMFYPRPRSGESVANALYGENRITFRPHFTFGETHQEIDLVLFLNGIPIVALEVKHEKNQNVHDAVAQFARRDQNCKIFRHPFLYLAADTSDVMAATDPSREENFRWHNTGLTNRPVTANEYPVEFLYREVLSKDHLFEALSFFLVRVPKREAEEDRQERPAFTLFPRYHQSRMVRKVADNVLQYFSKTGEIGRKYLIHHSAGSGKTLSICWLADRLHSLFKPDTNEKLVDLIFILTDRKSLDKNIKDEIENFTHLKEVVGLAKKAADLPRFLKERKPIIVTTQQKFEWVLKEIQKNEELKKLRVAFLIDEAHRSQEGKMGAAIRVPFRSAEVPDADLPEEDEEEKIAKIIREHDLNQLFVAFTATPAPATVTLFGEPFDTYSEAEAIAEGYIVDVATSIISYKTLYHLHCPIVPKPDEQQCMRLYEEIIAAGVFTQKDAQDFVKLVATGTDAQVQFTVNGLRGRFRAKIGDPDQRKAFVYLLARFAKSYHFLTCFFTYSGEVQAFAAFAEYIGPQLIKQGSVSELMKQIRRTEVVKAAVQFQGEVRSGGTVKLKPGKGAKGAGPPPKKVSVQDMIATIRARFEITDEEALYIKQVTEEKAADPLIRITVHAHSDDTVYLDGAYRMQVNGQIQEAYTERDRYDELADVKYTDTGGIFDIMAVTVIQHHLGYAG